VVLLVHAGSRQRHCSAFFGLCLAVMEAQPMCWIFVVWQLGTLVLEQGLGLGHGVTL
jgi:hypothetical protein